MKFWDTIAKMCGVTTRGRLSSRDLWDGDVMFGARALRVRWYHGRGDASLTIDGYGLRLRDSTEFNSACERPGLHIGLIDIERIRPMVAKIGRVNTDFVGSVLRDAHKDAADLPS